MITSEKYIHDKTSFDFATFFSKKTINKRSVKQKVANENA